MGQTKAGIEDIKIGIYDLARAAVACQELEIVAAGVIYATLIGYPEVIEKLTSNEITWFFDR